MTDLAFGLVALAATVVAPGWAVVRGLRLLRDPLAALVVGAAVGRVLFAAASLVATAAGGRGLLLGFAGLSIAAAALAERSARRTLPAAVREPPAARMLPALAAVAAGLVLVHAVVARSGLANAAGDLVFYGRDATNDPLVYAATALRLAEHGLPLSLAFAGGWVAPGSYGHYAVPAGLHLLFGLSVIDLLFRVMPVFDVTLMTLSGVVLARALGGGPLAAGATGVALALGTEPSFLVAPVAAVAGRAVQPLDSWAIFGPYLAAFNPVTPAVHLYFAAAVLLAREGRPSEACADDAAPSPGPAWEARPATAAVLAGLLVAATFEWKVFLWAPLLASLAAVAWLRPPAAGARALRLASVAALAGSLPSILDRVVGAQAVAANDETGLALCIACLPRYLANAAWGSHELSFALFRTFRFSDLARADVLAASAFASVCVLSVMIGARFAAIPALWRGARGGDARAGVHRWLALAALLGLGASLVLVVRPHFLNGAQLAWAATFGLWPGVGLELERLVARRRLAPAAIVVSLALLGTGSVTGRLGYDAPVSLRVSAGEQLLLGRLAALAGSGDVVLEPSMILDTDRPSPVPWITGRAVHLSLLSAVQSLPEEERNRRFDELVAIFAGSDPEEAGRALAASGARWVYVPAGVTLRYDPRALLEPVLESEAGVVYRVRAPAARSPAGG